jgi:NitT/TauT family transport system permease protein
MIGAEKGISAFVLSAGSLSAGSLSDVDNLTAGIVVLSAIGLAISWLLGRIERGLLAWRLDQPPRPVTSPEICI